MHKKLCRTFLTVMFLPAKNVLNKAILVLLMHCFCTLHKHTLGRHIIDVINSYVHRPERKLVTLG